MIGLIKVFYSILMIKWNNHTALDSIELDWFSDINSLPTIYGPRSEKTCLSGFANNKGADQPAHPRSLISTFVIRLLESIISIADYQNVSCLFLITSPIAPYAHAPERVPTSGKCYLCKQTVKSADIISKFNALSFLC